jgi:hypothetical protein
MREPEARGIVPTADPASAPQVIGVMEGPRRQLSGASPLQLYVRAALCRPVDQQFSVLCSTPYQRGRRSPPSASKLADLPKMKAELPTMLRLAVDVTFNAADGEPFLGGARMALLFRRGQLLASRALAHA